MGNMGCYMSRKHLGEANRQIFKVYNVNDLGAILNPGKIEVSETDLILHQKGKEPIHWPLRCLRRYGFDEELFSFESGRRCPTGPGIFAFKCRQAEELFNLVQDAIMRVGQEGHARTNQTIIGSTGRQNSRPTSVAEPVHQNGFLHVNGNGHFTRSTNEHPYINDSLVTESDPNYINTGANIRDNRHDANGSVITSALIDFLHQPPPLSTSAGTVNYADLDLPKSTENLYVDDQGASAPFVSQRPNQNTQVETEEVFPSVDTEEAGLSYADLEVFTDNPVEVTHQPTYINIGKGGTVTVGDVPQEKRCLAIRRLSLDRNYANVSASGSASSNLSHAPVQNSRSMEKGTLNYIEIDVNRSNDNINGIGGSTISPTSVSFSVVPDSPSKRTESYAMIDFNRTVALSNSARTVTDDEGLRKTRHNSTINDV
ncbi:hypothetical protein CHS0354_007438 [Potamilus streckersoni]|uniref:IRS-type PTB domain-containing protein n=1 Tax=Potamilus streckersoni TaxID=2493646 RepID=A0AAE0W2A3_9BIVA|nr:hypothetical protein CHS0354_007438 [Potamilus streckersoni]